MRVIRIVNAFLCIWHANTLDRVRLFDQANKLCVFVTCHRHKVWKLKTHRCLFSIFFAIATLTAQILMKSFSSPSSFCHSELGIFNIYTNSARTVERCCCCCGGSNGFFDGAKSKVVCHIVHTNRHCLAARWMNKTHNGPLSLNESEHFLLL